MKTLLTANRILRSSHRKGNRKGSRYSDVEEADFKEIEPKSNKANDKDARE